MVKRILTVCVGNICRSPMAQSLLTHNLRDASSTVSSAGLAALVGRPADPVAHELMLERGLSLAGHQATQLTRTLVLNAELVLVMEEDQQKVIEESVPVARGKVHRLGKWSGFDIPDPYGRSRLAFEQALELIEQGVNDWQERL